MAKPGIKEKKTTKYNLSITGKVVVQNDSILIDASENLDGSELVDIRSYLRNLNDEVVDVKVNQTEEEEL